MTSQLVGLLIGVASIVVFCGNALLVALRKRALLRREAAALNARRYTAPVAYQRYNVGITRLTRGHVQAAYIVSAIVFIVLLFDPTLIETLLGTGDGGETGFQLALPFLPIAVAASFALLDLLSASIADAPAINQLGRRRVSADQIMSLRLKMLLVNTLPVALAFELGAQLYAFGVDGALSALVAIVGVVAAIQLRQANSLAIQRWFYPTKRIEETPWAYLGARAQAWARLAQLPAPRVFVRETEALGMADSMVVSRGRGAIIFSDFFLKNSDWRQQDAFFCASLVLNAERIRRRRRILLYAYIGGPLVLVFIAAATVGIVLLSADAPTLAILLTLASLLVTLLFIVGSVIVRTQNRGRSKALYLDSDRRAVELTGDPYAVATALNTVIALTGVGPQLRYVGGASVSQRIAAVGSLIWQPGPRALWAYEPVPSIAPVQIGGLEITVPLDPQRIPPPAPVPTQPYPVGATAIYPQMAPVAPPQGYQPPARRP